MTSTETERELGRDLNGLGGGGAKEPEYVGAVRQITRAMLCSPDSVRDRSWLNAHRSKRGTLVLRPEGELARRGREAILEVRDERTRHSGR